MTKIEKIARAIDPLGWAWRDRGMALRPPGDTLPYYPVFASRALHKARAVLVAMREPTPAMVTAALNVYRKGGSVIDMYRAMIDAAMRR